MKTRTAPLRLLGWLAGFAALSMLASSGQTEMIDRELLGEPDHKVVYQFNKADPAYMDSVLFSVGEMLRKYSDNIHVVVTAIGPGIHILAKEPLRPVSDEVRERVASLAMYGVSFHACGNTMAALDWTESDMLDFAEVVDVGADDLMQLQEQGYSYISW
ncbi:MAG: DsrE family protein [Gammaproteobacteria bacterium]|jgi:intracellular sulfur oxidation DsrE/DsrF family protein